MSSFSLLKALFVPVVLMGGEHTNSADVGISFGTFLDAGATLLAVVPAEEDIPTAAPTSVWDNKLE